MSYKDVDLKTASAKEKPNHWTGPVTALLNSSVAGMELHVPPRHAEPLTTSLRSTLCSIGLALPCLAS